MHRFKGKKLTVDTGGYLCYKKKGIHRIIWEDANGPIPPGNDIHHIDFNKYNNAIENLQCLHASDHRRLHMLARSEELSVAMKNNSEKLHEWHNSLEGKRFFSNRIKKRWNDMEIRTFTCINCNKEFQSKHNTIVKYCGDNCVMAARRSSGVDNVDRCCVICSNIFIINRYQKTKTCSFTCRNLLISLKRRKSK